MSERDAALAEHVLRDVLIQLRTGTGHDFKHYKRATVLRRIERRMQVTRQPDLSAYYQYLQANPEETKALLGDMLIGVTNFFRDREAFEALERDVVPQLVSAVVSAQPEKEEIRVWSTIITDVPPSRLRHYFIKALRRANCHSAISINAPSNSPHHRA